MYYSQIWYNKYANIMGIEGILVKKTIMDWKSSLYNTHMFIEYF